MIDILGTRAKPFRIMKAVILYSTQENCDIYDKETPQQQNQYYAAPTT
jgi:hypothetical protein